MNEHDIGVIFLTRQEIHADDHDWRKAYERRRDKDPGDPPPGSSREVARMAYHTEWPVDKRIEELPYKIIPGEVGNFRNDVFLERAIVGERLRLAMGLPYRGASDPAPVSQGIEEADKPETYYTPPLINVIKFACNACPEKRVYVTDGWPGLPCPPVRGGVPEGRGESGPHKRKIQDRPG